MFVATLCATLAMSLIVMAARRFFFLVRVQHGSMSPALEDGEIVLAVRCLSRSWVIPGRVVILDPPLSTHLSYAIKRVVGVAGQTHELENDPDSIRTEAGRWVIPPGYCFVRGDNSAVSVDSRSWGPVPVGTVAGIVVFKLPASPGRGK